jgi:very-short-patch-repair endonuclease
MRREPTEPEKRLWRALSGSKLDGDTHDIDGDRQRDEALSAKGFTVLHVTNGDVMHNLDGTLQTILAALQQAPDRWESPHPNPSPQGEGLEG